MKNPSEFGQGNLCKIAIVAGALFAFSSVALGAFAAHGLKPILSSYQLGIFETASKYQMYHGLALILTGLLALSAPAKIMLINIFFIAGIVCFSGSLYLLALLELRWLALITPIGGVLFLLGWGAFVYQAIKAISNQHDH